MKTKTHFPTEPSIRYKCPKCGKEELCICQDVKYCNCTVTKSNNKSCRMVRLK